METDPQFKNFKETEMETDPQFKIFKETEMETDPQFKNKTRGENLYLIGNISLIKIIKKKVPKKVPVAAEAFLALLETTRSLRTSPISNLYIFKYNLNKFN